MTDTSKGADAGRETRPYTDDEMYAFRSMGGDARLLMLANAIDKRLKESSK